MTPHKGGAVMCVLLLVPGQHNWIGGFVTATPLTAGFYSFPLRSRFKIVSSKGPALLADGHKA